MPSTIPPQALQLTRKSALRHAPFALLALWLITIYVHAFLWPGPFPLTFFSSLLLWVFAPLAYTASLTWLCVCNSSLHDGGAYWVLLSAGCGVLLGAMRMVFGVDRGEWGGLDKWVVLVMWPVLVLVTLVALVSLALRVAGSCRRARHGDGEMGHDGVLREDGGRVSRETLIGDERLEMREGGEESDRFLGGRDEDVQ